MGIRLAANRSGAPVNQAAFCVACAFTAFVIAPAPYQFVAACGALSASLLLWDHIEGKGK